MATEDTTDKDIAYYLAHPEKVDVTDTKLVQQLEAAAAAAESETSGTAESSATPEAKAASDKPAPKTDDEGKAKTGTVEEDRDLEKSAAGIVSADGKHLIPLDVLQRAREEAGAAQEALRETMDTVLRLERELKDLRAGKTATAADTDTETTKTADEIEEQLKQVREDAPWLAPTIEALLKRQRDLEDQVAQAVERDANEDRAYEQQLQRESNRAISENLTLQLWKSNAPGLIAEAGKVDKFLRNDPEESKRYMRSDGSIDFARRFDDVVEIVKARHRNDEQPIPIPKAIEAKPGTKEPSDKAVKEAARAKLAQADTGVTTISDLPGGHAPAQSEEEAVDDMSVTQLARKLNSMTPEKLDAYLSRYN